MYNLYMNKKVYKSLNHLRQSLNIPEINTNKQFSHDGSANGIFLQIMKY
jgi:hypothetical protein